MKKALRSRADLLRSLAGAGDADHGLLAASFGYEIGVKQKDPTQNVESVVTGDDQTPSKTNSSLLLYEAKTQIALWTVSHVYSVNDNASADIVVEPDATEKLATEPVAAALPAIDLLQAGDWQNLWDGLIPKGLLSSRIDVPRAVLAASKSLPLDRLPRKSRVGANQSAVLLVEFQASLCPLFNDLRQLVASLRKNYSAQDLQVCYLPFGPTGTWYDAAKQPVSQACIDAASTVYLAGTLGAQTPNDTINPAWRTLIKKVQAKSKQLAIVSLMASPDVNGPVAVIDKRPLNKKELLLAALSMCWLPTVIKLRHLRLAIPGASLADELWVYNHDDVVRVGRQLKLKQETTLQYSQQFQDSCDASKSRIEACIAYWQQGYQGETAREAERLQQTLLNPPSFDSQYPRLKTLLRAVNENIKNAETTAESAFMRSLLPLTETLAPQVERDNSWQPLLATAQQFAVFEGRRLPWAHRGLTSTHKIGYLKQHGDELVLDDQANTAVLAEPLGNQSYCSVNNKVIQHSVTPTSTRFKIIDSGWVYELEALNKPTWAERFHRKSNGHLEAVHVSGVRFELIPASIEQAKSDWRLSGGLWPWAHQAGIDEHGLWAELVVKKAAYRLRWIPPGTFMMGSPEREQGHNSDENLHQVTLSEGYWLGETTLTKAFWLAVTGKKSSRNETDNQLPANDISWNDCNAFIKKLLKLVPSFQACMPTEAQWEYACRAGTQTRFWWGDDITEQSERINLSNGIQSENRFVSNRFGLKSMHGNIYEWCADWYGEYLESSVLDPKGPEEGQSRVLRGGCWIDEPQHARAAYRNCDAPDYRYRFFGFRLAGGFDPQAASKQGAAQTADRDEGTEEQRGGRRSTSRSFRK